MTTPTIKKPKILSFGIASVDFIAAVDHFPEPDEKMRSSSLIVEGGGNAANTACAIGRLSDYATVDCATAVGDDANGNTIIKGLEENGVGTKDTIERFQGGNSPFSYVLTTPDNKRTIIHQPATREMSLDFVKTNINLSNYAAVHFDCRHPKAAVFLADACVKADIPYSVDVERPREGLKELMKHAKVVICNSNYCNLILGAPENELSDQNIVERLRNVMEKQAPNAELALQTLGSKGACLIRIQRGEKDEQGDILNDKTGAPRVSCHDGAIWCDVWKGCGKVIDSTGAGDAFQGAFVTALWSFWINNKNETRGNVPTKALAHAMRIATRVAAMKLTKPGARAGLPFSSVDKTLQKEFEGLLACASKKV